MKTLNEMIIGKEITINGDDGDEGTFLILTDEMADKRAREYIRESLWAFKSEFILEHSKVKMPVIYLEELQGQTCESCNELVFALLEDFDEFVEDAVKADGRGHFIAQYDGKEIKLENGLYMYRVN